MELEQRVKTLEYEFKILKNEIQRTLLDIQEQILVHYYPALRQDETTPSDGIVQTVDQLRAKRGVTESAPPSPAPAPAVPDPASLNKIVEWAKQPTGDGASSPPAVKKVSLDDIRGAQADPRVAPPAAIDTGKLVEWAINCAAKLGAKRATRVVEVYGRKVLISAEVKTTLMRVTALSKDTGPDKVATNDVLMELLELDKALGRPVNPEEALALIEEANLG